MITEEHLILVPTIRCSFQIKIFFFLPVGAPGHFTVFAAGLYVPATKLLSTK